MTTCDSVCIPNRLHMLEYDLQIAVYVLQNFVGCVVFALANPRFFRFGTRITVVHRRLQQQTLFSQCKTAVIAVTGQGGQSPGGTRVQGDPESQAKKIY